MLGPSVPLLQNSEHLILGNEHVLLHCLPLSDLMNVGPPCVSFLHSLPSLTHRPSVLTAHCSLALCFVILSLGLPLAGAFEHLFWVASTNYMVEEKAGTSHTVRL